LSLWREACRPSVVAWLERRPRWADSLTRWSRIGGSVADAPSRRDDGETAVRDSCAQSRKVVPPRRCRRCGSVSQSWEVSLWPSSHFPAPPPGRTSSACLFRHGQIALVFRVRHAHTKALAERFVRAFGSSDTSVVSLQCGVVDTAAARWMGGATDRRHGTNSMGPSRGIVNITVSQA
jgi:hypothetical protein